MLILWGSLKNPMIRGFFYQKPIYKRGLPGKGPWIVWRFKRGIGEEEGRLPYRPV